MSTAAIALPNKITIGYQEINIVLIDTVIASNVGDQQGSYTAGPPPTIYLDKTIIEKGGVHAVNLVMHELNHHIESSNELAYSM